MITNGISIFISILPFSKFRRFLYNKLLNFSIDTKSRIGFLVIIQSKKCQIFNTNICSFNFFNCHKINLTDSNIEKFNRIKNLYLLKLKKTNIGSFNIIYGNKKLSDNAEFIVKENTSIRNYNYFDLNDKILIDRNCSIQSHCNFWTHSFDSSRSNITKGSINISEHVNIDSGVTIINSIFIGRNIEIKFGTIVHKSLKEKGIYGSYDIFKKN